MKMDTIIGHWGLFLRILLTAPRLILQNFAIKETLLVAWASSRTWSAISSVILCFGRLIGDF